MSKQLDLNKYLAYGFRFQKNCFPLPWGSVRIPEQGYLIPSPKTRKILKELIKEGMSEPLWESQRDKEVEKDIKLITKYVNISPEEGEALLRFLALAEYAEWIGWEGVERFLNKITYYIKKELAHV